MRIRHEVTRIRKEVGKSEEVGAYGEAIGNSVLEFEEFTSFPRWEPKVNVEKWRHDYIRNV